MEKQGYYHAVYDDSFVLWSIKMVLSAILTPVWILLQAMGIDGYNFN